MKCKDCKFCRCISGKIFGLQGYTRNEYFCENPEVHKLRDKSGRSIYNFIGYGEKIGEGKLTLKTSKRWCPLKEGDKK